MKDSFDTKLAEHIQNSLREHEMLYDEGAWESFDLQRKQKNRKPVLWLSIAASILVLLLAVPAYIYYKNPGAQVISNIKQPDSKSPVTNSNTAPAKEAIASNAPKKQSEAFSNQGDEIPKEDREISNNIPSEIATTKTNTTNGKVTIVNREKSSVAGRNKYTGNRGPNRLQNKNNAAIPEGATITVAAIPTKIITLASPATSSTILPIILNKPTESTKLYPNPILLATAPDQEPEKNKDLKKIRFSFSFSPQTQYAKDSYSQLNVGGGVLTEFPVSKRLSFNTGIQVAQQTLEVTAKNQNLVASKSLQSTDLQLTGLDIPVNLHYNFALNSKQKNHVAVGLSSFTYLGEQYAYNYKNTSTRIVMVQETNGPAVQKVETVHTLETESQSEEAFKDFYLAQLLNFSVGFERSFIKNTVLVIEPYTQIPLGKFTKEQIRFGTGGVHIRIGFNSFRGK